MSAFSLGFVRLPRNATELVVPVLKPREDLHAVEGVSDQLPGIEDQVALRDELQLCVVLGAEAVAPVEQDDGVKAS